MTADEAEPHAIPGLAADELRRVAADLLGHVIVYADDMLSYILERVPEASADDELRGLTLGSCSSNLEAALSMVRHGIDVEAASAPVTALEHARAMAQRGYSVDVMLRFYRMGHAFFSERVLPQVSGFVPDGAVALQLATYLQGYAFAYVDRVSSEVAAEYVAELDRIQNRVRAARTDAVRTLIDGDDIDLRRAEQALSHRLTSWQTAFVCWTTEDDADLPRLGHALGAALGSRRPLLVADGAQVLWGWIGSSSAPHPVSSDLTSVLRDLSVPAQVSIGRPALGAAGFRTSHLQAQRARRVVDASGTDRTVTWYADVALADTMSGDLELARSFVATELGDLAIDGARQGQEREALLAVLDAQGGLAAAAEQLSVHRNTVLQRVRRAEERRSRPATERVAEVHAALRLVQALGPAVLVPAADRS